MKILDLVPFKIFLTFFYVGKIASVPIRAVFFAVTSFFIYILSINLYNYVYENKLSPKLLPQYPENWPQYWNLLYTVIIPVVILFTIYMLIVFICSVIVKISSGNVEEEYIAHNFIATMIVTILVAPAIYIYYTSTVQVVTKLCDAMTGCSVFTRHFISFISVNTSLYCLLFFVNSKKIWPIHIIERDCPVIFSLLLVGIIEGIILSIIIYFCAFIILDMKVVYIIEYFRYLYLGSEIVITLLVQEVIYYYDIVANQVRRILQ